MQTATFGIGCFWGAEDIFLSLYGVASARVGFMGGWKKLPSYEEVCEGDTGHIEVVELSYNPEKISYQELLGIFWQLHDPTSLEDQGPYEQGYQYRAVIFVHNDEQAAQAMKSKDQLESSGNYSAPIVTDIRPATTFWPAQEYHQRYIRKGGDHACNVYNRNVKIPEHLKQSAS